MTNAGFWEVTEEDVQTVLDAHKIILCSMSLSELHDELDFDKIEEGVSYFVDIDDQTNSMLSDIEDQLVELNIIPGDREKKFVG